MMLIIEGNKQSFFVDRHATAFIRLFPLAITNESIPRRTFVTEDPYDGRNEFKVSDVRPEKLHSKLCDRDSLTEEKLNQIFGKMKSYSKDFLN